MNEGSIIIGSRFFDTNQKVKPCCQKKGGTDFFQRLDSGCPLPFGPTNHPEAPDDQRRAELIRPPVVGSRALSPANRCGCLRAHPSGRRGGAAVQQVGAGVGCACRLR